MEVGAAEAAVVSVAAKGVGNSDGATRTIDQPVLTAVYAMLDTGFKTGVSCLARDRNSVLSIGRCWKTAKASEGDKDLQTGRGETSFDGHLSTVTIR